MIIVDIISSEVIGPEKAIDFITSTDREVDIDEGGVGDASITDVIGSRTASNTAEVDIVDIAELKIADDIISSDIPGVDIDDDCTGDSLIVDDVRS